MKIKITADELMDIVKRYVKEQLKIDGDAKLDVEKYYDQRDGGYLKIEVLITAKVNVLGKEYNAEKTLYEKDIKDILNFYLRAEGIEPERIAFKVQNGTTLDYVEIDIRQNVRKRGEI